MRGRDGRCAVARAPKQRRPVIRVVVLVLAVALAALALIAALVWRPLVSSLHLDPAALLARIAPADAKALPAGAARAP